jgi:hypothetical protein
LFHVPLDFSCASARSVSATRFHSTSISCVNRGTLLGYRG